jgi:hypothetical protein
MSIKKIKLVILIFVLGILEVNSQSSSYFRSDTNRIKFISNGMESQPNSTGGDSIYAQTVNSYNFQGYDTIYFNHRITNSSGTTQRIVVQLIDSYGNIVKNLKNIGYTGSNSNFQMVAITVDKVGSYNVRFSFFRQGGNNTQKFEMTAFTIVTPSILLEEDGKINKREIITTHVEDEDEIQIFNDRSVMVFEGGYKDFLKNHAEVGKLYITVKGYKFIKQ